MKFFKRIFIGIVIYLLWKQVSFPLLVVGMAFLGAIFFDKDSETGQSLTEARHEIMREFGAWLNRIDPNTIVYAAALVILGAFIFAAIRLLIFSRTRKDREGQYERAGGNMFGQGRNESVDGSVPENFIKMHNSRNTRSSI